MCLIPGRGFDNLTSVHLARHTPTGTLVTVKITNLENCTEERLRALQVTVRGQEVLEAASVRNVTPRLTDSSLEKVDLIRSCSDQTG